MSVFRPQFQQQGPACNCQIGGKCLGWLSCTAYAMAMLIDRATLGKKRPSGCAVRRGTGDTTGGTMLSQCAIVAIRDYSVPVTVRVGSNTISPASAAAELKKGRPFVLQGGASAMVGTSQQSTNGPVNHAVLVNEGRGFDDDIPEEGLVYDPAADGRRDMDQGPTWWPWTLILKFASHLEPDGEGTGRLGPGHFYAAVGPDTEPHVILRFGGVRTKPFPDRTRAVAAKGELVNVRSSPTHQAGDNIVGHLEDHQVFTAYQKTDKGASFHGSTLWYGSQDGLRWVHAARLSHEGGST